MDRLDDLMLQFEVMIAKEEKRHITDDDRRDQLLTTIDAIETTHDADSIRLLISGLDFNYIRRLAGLKSMQRVK